jgi:hypothetical protein
MPDQVHMVISIPPKYAASEEYNPGRRTGLAGTAGGRNREDELFVGAGVIHLGEPSPRRANPEGRSLSDGYTRRIDQLRICPLTLHRPIGNQVGLRNY